jgi:hypothetical protein
MAGLSGNMSRDVCVSVFVSIFGIRHPPLSQLLYGGNCVGLLGKSLIFFPSDGFSAAMSVELLGIPSHLVNEARSGCAA